SLRVAAAVLALALVGGACAGDPVGSEGAGEGGDAGARGEVTGTVRVFAAASLTDAFGEIAAAFERRHPGASVELSFDASSTLATQAAEGAPADVLATADEHTMAGAVDAGVTSSPPREVARNALVLAVPPGNPGGVDGLSDLTDPDLFVGLCADEVPCGRLAGHVLADAGVAPAVDTREPNVRSLLTKLTAGELEAGLVYRTDAQAAGDRVEIVPVAGLEGRTTVLPVAPLDGGGNPGGGEAFVRFVLGREGRQALAAAGFGEP
ncbi:MAG TPA: molybdate ABC transporter substrate-binding protein, partial [Acidimicrobiales bacterium]